MSHLITLEACCEVTVDMHGVVWCSQPGSTLMWFEDSTLLATGRDHVRATPPTSARVPDPVTLKAGDVIACVRAHGGARVTLQDGAPVHTNDFFVDCGGHSVVTCERVAPRCKMDVCTTGQSEARIRTAPTLLLSAQAHGTSKMFIGVPAL